MATTRPPSVGGRLRARRAAASSACWSYEVSCHLAHVRPRAFAAGHECGERAAVCCEGLARGEECLRGLLLVPGSPGGDLGERRVVDRGPHGVPFHVAEHADQVHIQCNHGWDRALHGQFFHRPTPVRHGLTGAGHAHAPLVSGAEAGAEGQEVLLGVALG
eukprot:911085-Pyramimonas_sp.AAC.2